MTRLPLVFFLRRAMAAWLPVLLIICWAPRLCALNLYTYDLDSLVYMSPQVVEGRLVRHYKQGHLDLDEVEVTAVHKGEFKVGQLIPVMALDFYRVPKAGDLNPGPLPDNSPMFFFLDKAVSSFGYDVPENASIYCTAPAGLKLVQNDKVIGFTQHNNPGPYEAQIPDADDFLPTPKEFAFLIGMSVRKTNALAERFKKPPSIKDDAAWLVHLLGEKRYDSEFDFQSRDYIAELACIRVANLHEPDAIRFFLKFKLPNECAGILRRGLGSPAGREFVLQKIGDPHEPKETRLRYAQTLGAMGSIYHSTNTDISDDGYKPTGSAVKGNAAYLTRIAQAAQSNSKDEELCLAIVEGLKASTDSSTPSNADLRPDLDGAVAALKKLHPSASEKVQFQIEETVAWILPAAYPELKSKCGPIASLLSAGDPETILGRKGRLLPYEYSISVLEAAKVDKMYVVLENRNNGRKVKIPTNIPFSLGGKGSGGGSATAEIPEDLPKGKYRIFLEFDHEDHKVSTGHFFDADL